MKSVGIIGFGSFGAFLAEKLDGFCEVRVWDVKALENQWQATLADTAGSDVVVLAVPLAAYPTVLAEIKPLMRHDTVLVDVCSVKQKPIELIQEIMPNQPLVATHPLFGPESARASLDGHTLVICPEVSDVRAVKQIKGFAGQLGLRVVLLSAEEHDREMAIVHGLTFFIARSLAQFGLRDQTLSTPSFQELLDIEHLEEKHSEELFYTIQAGNPETKGIRQRFLQIAQKLDEDIGAHDTAERVKHDS